MPDLASESQPLVSFLASIEDGIDRIVRIYDRIAPEWVADRKVPDNWAAFRSVFPNELLIKQRILNDPQILRKMELHGLVGPSLESKAAFLKKAAERFRELNEKESTDVADKRKASSWLLRVINSYLVSLAGVFPGLVSVQEFTQQIELAVEAPL
ncbi:MAG TPA: hypothetical protein VJZ75_11170 [Candidatus Bathyarchaeia archaeon]|nr:hypothetical protein [Candidatus Bathyarchaeia archaeon]